MLLTVARRGSTVSSVMSKAPAPRTPGKKRSTGRSEKKLEDAVAAAIADWIDKNWNDTDWGGAPKEIPRRIRAGEWREAAQ